MPTSFPHLPIRLKHQATCPSAVFAAIAAVVALTGATSGSARAAPSERCYADWSQAAEIVRSAALVTAKDVHERARLGQIGDVVRMTLCEENGRYVYRLVVREAKGQVIKLTVDAKTPF